MNIYIDESGSINNKISNMDPYFIIALIHVHDDKGKPLKNAYKRFVSSNMDRLRELDVDKYDANGKLLKAGGKMFVNGKFHELKGNQFDPSMKRSFLQYITRNNYFEVYFIRVFNSKLSNAFCENTARGFNYCICLSLKYYLEHGFLPNENCNLQLDERNERTETKHFLANYLNTELKLSGVAQGTFSVQYYDSANNYAVQIADVFANWYYSQLKTGAYTVEWTNLKNAGIIRHVFDFPL